VGQRTIDVDARGAIVERLGIGSPPRVPVLIEFVSGSTSEPYDFAKAIKDTLTAGGWKVSRMDGGPTIGNPPRGLIIRISDIGGVDDEAYVLQGALEAGGLSTTRLVKDRARAKEDELFLMVGLKP
jgi:hypothetical protein